MNNEVYNRLKKLAEMEGTPLTDGSDIKAEITAYSVGITMVCSKLDEVFNTFFVCNSSDYGICHFLDLLQISAKTTDELTKDAIIARLSRRFGDFKFSELEQQFYQRLPNATYSYLNGEFTVKSFVPNKISLSQLGRFIEDELPPFMTIKSDGSGLCWNSIDVMAMPFYIFDNLKCPFTVLDTLKEITNE